MFSAGARFAFEHFWTHLTQLRVTLGSKHLLSPDILALCPHLRDLTFSSMSISLYDVERHALTHSNLRWLNIRVLRGTRFLLDALTLPALRYLKIRIRDLSYTGRTTWPQNEFKAFVARWRCPLKTLKILKHCGNVSSKEEAECVALIPTLKHVNLRL